MVGLSSVTITACVTSKPFSFAEAATVKQEAVRESAAVMLINFLKVLIRLISFLKKPVSAKRETGLKFYVDQKLS